MDTLLTLYTLLCAAAFFQAGVMFLHAWEHSRYHASRRKCELSREFLPRVTLFVPCKGLDLNFDANLRALFEQQYPTYELCFIVESAGEPVVTMVHALQAEYPGVPCRVVFAGEAADCGQKVHNLMVATRTVAPDTEVMAFVDSDTRPHRQFLAWLVSRLRGTKYAVSTGYRWYVPVAPTWANLLLSAINNSIGGLMGGHGFNLVWGGAWAIRVQTFRDLGLPDAWHGSLSDDLVVSRLVHRARLRLVYEPHCLVTSPAQTTLLGLAEFIRRQYLVVRVYAPGWWAAALWAGIVSNFAFWSSFVLSIVWASTGRPWWFSACCGLIVYTLISCRAAICTAAIEPFVKASLSEMQRVARVNIWLWPLVSLNNWLGLLSAGIGRTITWRGIRYRMISPSQTVIEHRTRSQQVQRVLPRAA